MPQTPCCGCTTKKSALREPTSLRGTRFEVPHSARGFDAGAFDAQGIATIPDVQLLRRLGVIDGATLAKIEAAVKTWLGLA